MKLFNVIDTREANEQIQKFLKKNLKTTEIDLKESMGYTLATAIYAQEDTPAFYKSTVDGYAIIAQDTMGASESTPAVLNDKGSVEIGVENTHELASGDCLYLNTGAMLPKNATGVVMIEQTEKIPQTNEILVYTTVAHHQNVTIPGTDVAKGNLLFEKNQPIDERVMAVLASQGIHTIKVYEKLTAIIISSGNELVPYDSEIAMGEIRDTNVFLIKGLLEKHGITVKETFLIEDDFKTYTDVLKNNDADLYITSGGSSQGNEDFTYDVFHQLTGNVICHGLAIKPGKPTIIANTPNRLYLGLPGNPVSAYLVLKKTLIKSFLTTLGQDIPFVKGRLIHNMAGAPGKDTIILAKLTETGGETWIKPIFYRSSSLLSLSEADGYFVIKAGLEGVDENEEVEVILF